MRSIFIIENTCLDQPHQKRIYRLAYKYMANHEDAEDIVQEVLCRLWDHRDLTAIENVVAWTAKVTRNVCLDALRQRKSYRLIVSAQDPELSLRKAIAIEINMPQYLIAALSQLDNPYRTLVLMRDVEGLSYEVISQDMKIPLNTVKVYIHRGRRLLRTFLK